MNECFIRQRNDGKHQKLHIRELVPVWVVENAGGRKRKNRQSYSPVQNTRMRGLSMEIKSTTYKTVKRKYILYNA